MRNIRSGSYALYKNFTFELSTLANNRYELISRDDINNSCQNLGFVKYNETVCYLLINKDGIESAYYVYTFCTYKGYKFQVSGGVTDMGKLEFRILLMRKFILKIWPIMDMIPIEMRMKMNWKKFGRSVTL